MRLLHLSRTPAKYIYVSPPPFFFTCRTGYERLVFARPELYDLLLAKIPAEKIHLSKKVVAMIQDEDAVAVRCQDKSVYVADLLVGADGAYSGVRQSLYNRLEKDKLLPECDKRSLNKGYFCLVGTTDRLDAARFPQLREMYSDASLMISDNSPHSVRNGVLDFWLYFVATWLPPLVAVAAQ